MDKNTKRLIEKARRLNKLGVMSDKALKKSERITKTK